MKRILMYLMSLGLLYPVLKAQPLAIQHISGNGASNSYSVSHDLTRSASGDLYMSGEFQGVMVMPDSSYTSYGIAGLQTPDGFISKYSASGQYQWTIQVKSEIYGKIEQLHYQAGVGCWALINSMNGTILDSVSISHPGDFIDIVALFSENGELLFHQPITASGGIFNMHFALGSNNELFLTGMLEGNLSIGSYSLSHSNSPAVGFLVRMKGDGTVSWGQKIGNQNLSWGHPSVGAAGEVYITGRISADDQIPAQFGNQTITQETVWDLFVARFDSTGALEWLHTSPDASQNVSPSAAGWAASYDPSGHVYVTGEFAGNSLDFGGTVLTNDHSGKDFFLAKFSDSGNLIWALNNGGMTQAARGRELALGDQGEVFVQGTYGVGTQGGFQMDLGSGANQVTLPFTADEDIFQAAFSSNGDLLWAETGNGYSDDFSGGIVAIGNGQAAFSGGFQDTLLLPDTMLVSTPDLISTNAFLTWSGQQANRIFSTYVPPTWSLHPNPSSGVFTTSLPSVEWGSTWVLRDLSGKMILREQATSTSMAWDLKALPEGIYLLSLHNQSSVSTRKVLISRS